MNKKDTDTEISVFEEFIRDGFEDRMSLIKTEIEKLTGALYKITDMLHDREPLKWKLREQALLVFSHFTVVKDKSAIEAMTLFHDALSDTDRMISLLDVIFMPGFVLEMNLSIIKKEYSALRDVLRHEEDLIGRRYRTTFPHIHILGTQPKTPEIEPVVKDTIVPVRSEVEPSAEGGRKARILAFLEKNADAAIKDITALFRDVSEKTVQRELLAMVSDGTIEKRGERRWSRYNMKH